MPRYEFSEGSSNKFWEIELAGLSFRTTYGKIGAKGQTTIKEFESPVDAKREYDKLIAEKTKKGYALADGSGAAAAAPTASAHARNAKLEAAIEAAPDDVDGYKVYADWLQDQGDPRGELIALHAGKRFSQAKTVFEREANHLYGKLADFTDMLEPGFANSLGTRTTWRWGYLEKLWISHKADRSSMHGGKKPGVAVSDALDWILGHPSSRFLRELVVGIVSYKDNTYAEVAKVIGKHPMPTLRKLVLGDFYYEETELNWSHMGNVEPMYKAVPNLESLILRSGTMKLGTLVLPKLRELQIISGGLDKASFASIMGAKLPLLERLNLQLGQELKWKLAELQPIFDGTLFPKLKHLGLGNSPQGDQICQALAASRIAAQLESLDMTKGTMGDIGAAALAAGKFPNLATLDVTKCYLSDVGVQAIAKAAKTVEADDQQEDDCEPDERYISGRE